MFLVNSRFSLVSAALSPSPQRGFRDRAPLLPRLRGHFAEFLHHGSLVRLGMLCPTTCVGIGYGRLAPSRRGFSRHHRITLLPHPKIGRVTITSNPCHLRQPPGFAWAAGRSLGRAVPQGPRRLPLCVTPVNTLAPARRAPRPHTPPAHHRQEDGARPKKGARGRGLAATHRLGRCFAGTGMSTRCPSTTPVGLALGPDSPRAD